MTWRLGKDDSVVSDAPSGCKFADQTNRDAYGGYLVCESVSEEHARRIVACVNALSGADLEFIERQLADGMEVVNVMWRPK